MALIKRNGKLLKIGGKLATSLDCCCGVVPCDQMDPAPSTTEQLHVYVNKNQDADKHVDGPPWPDCNDDGILPSSDLASTCRNDDGFWTDSYGAFTGYTEDVSATETVKKWFWAYTATSCKYGYPSAHIDLPVSLELRCTLVTGQEPVWESWLRLGNSGDTFFWGVSYEVPTTYDEHNREVSFESLDTDVDGNFIGQIVYPFWSADHTIDTSHCDNYVHKYRGDVVVDFGETPP